MRGRHAETVAPQGLPLGAASPPLHRPGRWTEAAPLQVVRGRGRWRGAGQAAAAAVGSPPLMWAAAWRSCKRSSASWRCRQVVVQGVEEGWEVQRATLGRWRAPGQDGQQEAVWVTSSKAAASSNGTTGHPQAWCPHHLEAATVGVVLVVRLSRPSGKRGPACPTSLKAAASTPPPPHKQLGTMALPSHRSRQRALALGLTLTLTRALALTLVLRPPPPPPPPAASTALPGRRSRAACALSAWPRRPACCSSMQGGRACGRGAGGRVHPWQLLRRAAPWVRGGRSGGAEAWQEPCWRTVMLGRHALLAVAAAVAWPVEAGAAVGASVVWLWG